MWRSRLQVQCEHGTWRSPYGVWFGEPSDPVWFKPEMSDENFLAQAQQLGIAIHHNEDANSNFPEDLDWRQGDPWFSMDLDLLKKVNFDDPKGQLSEITHLLSDMARDLEHTPDQIRLVMYKTPNS